MSTELLTPEEHSDIVGGSTAARRLGCPRSLYLESLTPKVESDSEYAREGTALHEMVATVLKNAVDEPTSLLPFTYTRRDAAGVELWSFTVDLDLWVDKGQPALAAFDDFLARVEGEWEQEFDLLVEQRVAFPGIPGAYGTSDVVGRCGPEIFVFDWKFGRNPVDAWENAQLMFYAVGAMNSCAEFLKVKAEDVARAATLVIIQPMAKEIISLWETDVDELNQMAADLRAAVDEGRHQKQEARIAKGKWCDYARCKTICPLHTRDVSAMVEKMVALKARSNGGDSPLVDLPTKPVEGDGPHRVTVTTSMPASTAIDWSTFYGDMLDIASTVEAWCSEIAKQAHDFAMSGGTVAGRTLVAKTGGARSWAKGEEEVQKFFKNRKFTLDEYMPRKLLSLPQGEKLLKSTDRELPEDMVQKPGVSGYKLVQVARADPDTVVSNASALGVKLAAIAGAAK